MKSPVDLDLRKLLQKFPGLGALGGAVAAFHRVPVIQQTNTADCGAACLAMVLAYHGKRVRIEELRERIGIGRDGSSIGAIAHAARQLGLRPRAVSLDLEDLTELPRGSIMHWEFDHVVVFERFDGTFLYIVDPARGRRRIPLDRANLSVTGVVLLLDPAEDFERGKSGAATATRALLGALGQDRRWVRIVAISFAMQVFLFSLPVVMGVIADQVVPHADRHLLSILGVGLLGICVFNTLAAVIRAHLLLEFRTALDIRLSVSLLDQMASLPFSFFQKRRVGDLLVRLDSAAAVRDLLTASTLTTLVDGAMVLVAMLLLLTLAPVFGAVTVGLGLVQVLTLVVARRRLENLAGEELAMRTVTRAYEVEMMYGIETLKSMGREEAAVERWSHHFVDSTNVGIDRGRLSGVVNAIQGSLQLSAPLITIAVGAVLVLDHGLSFGAMLGMQSLALAFLSPLGRVATAAEQLLRMPSHLERMDDVFGSAPEQDPDAALPVRHSLSGRISLERVTFRYNQMVAPTVKDVSAEIQPGQFVAIVGRTGSGKTTLARLLLGLYPPTSGRMLYDGLDLGSLDLRDLRSELGVVLQQPYVFADSIRRNIAIGDPDMPLSAVIDAAKTAALHEDIEAMPMGYDTIVSDGGGSLSGGQRQRLALARALATRPSIVVLDEATSALDARTEAKVQATIAGLGCTRIVIAHRLSTIVQADLILVMKDGEIVERGTHADLLQRGGEYRALIEAQLADARAARTVAEELDALGPAAPR